MTWFNDPAVGDTVSYRDVNQWRTKGKLIAMQPGKNGGDCIVEWTPGARSEECRSNLYGWTTPPTDQQIEEELAALGALLEAHPHYGQRALSVQNCLDCRKIPTSLKTQYAKIHNRNYPTSTPIEL